MIHQELSDPNVVCAGTVLVSGKGAKPRVIGEVLALQGGEYELVLEALPSPSDHTHIKFKASAAPGRRHLAALIETATSDVRVEIGQVDIGKNATAEIHVFGDPGFPARLVF